MKLEISQAEAFIFSTIFASLFVVSVYIWKPLVTPPVEIKRIWLKKRHNLTQFEKKTIEMYEVRMRIQSVGTLCLLAFLFLIMRSSLGERREVGVLQWFGLSINMQVLRQTLMTLILNSVLFAGEIWQLLRGMARVNYEYDLIAFKNLLCAPLLEEFIYRVCLINMFIESGALGPSSSVLLLPFFFAISHLHHMFDQ